MFTSVLERRLWLDWKGVIFALVLLYELVCDLFWTLGSTWVQSTAMCLHSSLIVSPYGTCN